MSLTQQIARWFLRWPARLYDLFAIVFVSAGINVLTGAGGTQHEALAALSGILLGAAGALLTCVKSRCDNIERSVESSIAADSEDIARELTGRTHDGSNRTPTSTIVAMREARNTPEPLEDALDLHLSKSGTGWKVALQCIGLIVLIFIGSIGAFWTLYATDEVDQSRALEDAASAVNQRVVLEISQIKNELIAHEAEHGRALEDAATAGNQRLLAEIEQIKNQLATLSRAIGDLNRPGDISPTIVPNPEPAKN